MIEVKKLKTERLELKKLTIGDLDDYYEWMSQEEYHNFLPSIPLTKEKYNKILKRYIKDYDNKKEPTLIWGMYYNDKLIGSVSVGDWHTTYKWCEIGWGLNPKFQKQGFAYESAKCLIEYIFNVLQMNRVSVVIWDGNESSINLAKKLGFKREGIERQARFKNGKFYDLYCYGLLKEEWEK